ncbi:hypothetical protein ACNI3Q_04145 [Sphingomonas sp. FW199]|uniref:hypothetical protein n=1 Tax=Sphingomonas sp. FW199 TaxID=3400217 RepID=UPI003CE8572B
MRFASLAALGLWAMLLTGCAVPEARLRAGLIDAGLSRPLSACMAERMVDRLNLAQLRRMGDLPRARDAVTLDRFLRRVRALGDPEIWTVTSTSAAICAVSG